MGRRASPEDPASASPRAGAAGVGGGWWVALSLLWLGLACASSHLVATGAGYRNTQQNYSIGAPGGPGPPWQRTHIDGAWIAFRRPGPQTISMQSRCGRPVAHPAIMARSLLLGVRERDLLQAGPVVVAGRTGWSQTFDTRTDGVVVRVKTVTVVIERCTYDWMLAAVGEFGAVERVFDAWWGTFHLDPAAGGAEESS